MFSILSGDGIRLAVYDYRPDAKKTVLLLHGWPFSHEIFEYQILALTGLGYRVIAPDFRGFGASDSPVSGYGYDQLASDLYGIVASLNLFSFTLSRLPFRRHPRLSPQILPSFRMTCYRILTAPLSADETADA